MRPTPIPDAEVWAGATRRVIAAPDGDLTNPDIAPVEALVDHSPSTGAVNLSVRCELEDGDLAALQAGGVVWLTFWGAMVPWSASVVAPPPGERREERWVRRDDLAVIHLDEHGLVSCTAEVLHQLLVDAGWEPQP